MMNEPATEPVLSPTEVARQWIEQSIAAGEDPHMALDQKPTDGQRRLWLYRHSVDIIDSLRPEHLPKELFRPAFAVCKELGRITLICTGPMPWHEDMLPGDHSPHAVGVRLKAAREAMAMDIASFYKPLGIKARTAKNWEAGKRKDWRLYQLERLHKEHFIPFWWMGYGNRPEERELAQDIEPRAEEAAS